MTVGMALSTPTVADLERRPKLRGVLHLIAAPVFALDGLVLTTVARTTGARLACAVYAASAVALVANSATLPPRLVAAGVAVRSCSGSTTP